jgi:hypothetical protein
MIAAVGLGALLQLFVQTARSAKLDSQRAQAFALGAGVISEWQARPRAAVRSDLAQGRQAWPTQPARLAILSAEPMVPPPQRPLFWQWRWEGDLPASGPLHLQLFISSDWDNPLETVSIPATL